MHLGKSLRKTSADLCDLKRVSKAVVKNMSRIGCDNLGNLGESSERGCVKHPVTILLSRTPQVGSIALTGWTNCVPPGISRFRIHQPLSP
jgi:hypothetical protein